jgi:hypothetical protein
MCTWEIRNEVVAMRVTELEGVTRTSGYYPLSVPIIFICPPCALLLLTLCDTFSCAKRSVPRKSDNDVSPGHPAIV